MILNFLCSSKPSPKKMITFLVCCILSFTFSDMSNTGVLALLQSDETNTGFFDDYLRLDGGKEFGWDTSKWLVQVDGVMGGKSTGSLTFMDDKNGNNNEGIMKFTGDINLNGGGFSSVRKMNFSQIDLSKYSGIIVELETTHAYNQNGGSVIKPPLGLHLQLHDATSYYGYASAFAIPLTKTSGESTSVYLPLQSFDRGSRSGYSCSSCKLDITTINEIDVYVLFQKGPFDVRIKSITAVKSLSSLPLEDDINHSFVMSHHPVITLSTKDEINELITKTISSGGSLYDYGYKELCIAIYKSTLYSLLVEGSEQPNIAVTDAVKGMICQGLERVSSKSISTKQDIAWNLRYTLDGILEELGFKDPDKGSGWRPSNTNTNPQDSFSLYYANNTCTNIGLLLPSSLADLPVNDATDTEDSSSPSDVKVSSSPDSTTVQNTSNDDNNKGTTGIILGVCVGAFLVVLSAGLYGIKKKNSNNQHKAMAAIHEDFDTTDNANMKKDENDEPTSSLAEVL